MNVSISCASLPIHIKCWIYKVDATVLEVGIGGASDSTNIVPKPIVTGVSALGLDHTAVLGKTLSEIAWQKGGIYKVLLPVDR